LSETKKCIAVDFDGTLSYYDGWKGLNDLGPPVEPMVQRVRDWLADGHDVWIFTARIEEDYNHLAKNAIERWCLRHIGKALPITNIKSMRFNEFWDDLAYRVVKNTGERCCGD
jgi:hypothetical protein